MKHIGEPARKTPVMAETDVLVVGSGPGGLSAALAAARESVDTMLVERLTRVQQALEKQEVRVK